VKVVSTLMTFRMDKVLKLTLFLLLKNIKKSNKVTLITGVWLKPKESNTAKALYIKNLTRTAILLAHLFGGDANFFWNKAGPNYTGMEVVHSFYKTHW